MKIPEPILVYQLHIELLELSPKIWRRLNIDAETNLFELHHYIQFAFNWKNYHLYQFNKNHVCFSDPRLLEEPVIDVKVVSVNALLKEKSDTLLYNYDFGDDWMHLITLEDIRVVRDGSFRRPECTGGERSAPPEDVGGIPGFKEFLEAWRTPGHPEHTAVRRWVGKQYNPDFFDFARVNSNLRMRKKYIREYDFNINMHRYR